MLLDSLEKQKEAKEAEKDAALQTYETMIGDLEQQKKDRDEFFKTVIEKLDNINNPQPTEGIDSVINNTYDDPNEANEVKQGLKDVENAVKDGTEQAKDNANEVKKADNNTTSSANKTDNKSQSANSKTATTANSNNTTVEKQQPVNVTIGDIHIDKPVGDVEQFAKALKMNIHPAFDRQIHTNLKY